MKAFYIRLHSGDSWERIDAASYDTLCNVLGRDNVKLWDGREGK